MWHDEDRHARRPDGGVERPQIIEQADLGGDLRHARPRLAGFGQEIVVGVEQQVGGMIAWIRGRGHRYPPSLVIFAVGRLSRCPKDISIFRPSRPIARRQVRPGDRFGDGILEGLSGCAKADGHDTLRLLCGRR